MKEVRKYLDLGDRYLTDMKTLYATEDGGYKNVLYPDLEVAGDVCKEMLAGSVEINADIVYTFYNSLIK